MSKRLFWILSMLAALVLALAACSQQAATPAAQEEPAEEQATEAPAAEAPAEEPAEEEAAEEAPAAEVVETPTDYMPGGFLERAYAGEFAGTTVEIDSVVTDEDEVKFLKGLEAFEEATGIDINYVGSKEFEAAISVRVDGGDAPDIALFPQPGLLASFVRQGKVVDPTTWMSEEWLKQQYNQSWLDMATIEGQMSGVWHRFNVKSLVWYPKKQFDAAGYEVPQTWDELMTLTQTIADDGDTAWCIGIESGAATGWVATDWTEEMLLRTAPPEVYDQWVSHEIPFSSPEVKNAIETWSEIWLNDDYVYGGRKSIVTIFIGDSPVPMFEDPPQCWFHRQANWVTGFFPEGLVEGEDYDFFYFPPKDPAYGNPWLVAGDEAAMFNDRPEVRAAMEYFTTPESVSGFLEQGGAMAAHQTATPEMYKQKIEQKIGALLEDATTFRFDASDLMPGEVGAGSFWKGMTDYVTGAADLDTVLQEIDDSWPAGVESQTSMTSASGDEETMAGDEPLEIDPIRIAVVMPSTTTDLAWSQAIYDALLRIQERAGGDSVVEISFTENMFNVTDAAAALRDYAADGNDIVIAHGTQYGTSMFEIAPDFPDTTFAWGTATDTGAGDGLTNIFAYEARAEQGGYVNGVLAANLSESGVIGVVGPVEAGDAKLYIDGFVAGAKAANPDATVNVSYTGSFGDTALAAEAANTHIQAGADVLTGSAQQVVGAIGVASDKGVPWMGTQSDQSPLAPDIVVSTQLYVWDDVLIDIIKKHQAGEFGGTAYALTLENGGLKMLYGDSLPEDAVGAAKDTEAAIVSGEIVVEVE